MSPSPAKKPTPDPTDAYVKASIESVVVGENGTPHSVLGAHPGPDGITIRAWRPDASAAAVILDDGERHEMKRVHDAGVFETCLPGEKVPDYRLEVGYGDHGAFTIHDPYRFWPTLGEVDLYLIGEGRHHQLWEVLGSHHREHQGVWGTSFAVWAPSARSVRVIGDFNGWDGRIHPMRSLGSSGVWELFLPDVAPGALYKFEILTQDGHLRIKADPMAFRMEVPPGQASIVHESRYEWGDADWVRGREESDPVNARLSIYEVHLGSWMRVPEEDNRPLTYAEAADRLGDHVSAMGFTHVELLPIAEHPYAPSWGYQGSSWYAPTSRFGTPDDFRAFVDTLHRRGIGVIVDWVPAHFPKDDWALARFDGTALYEHADPRQGEHPDWGTLVFNFGRNEVRNFLLANALYWIEEFHIDGLRVDAVASMLYLDYSRKEGEWVPNEFGGRENLEAISFLQETNTVVHGKHPGVLTIAEESTAFPGVSRPVYLGGLGFTHKWNMGWMHDTLEYFSKEPVHRRFHHHQLTFGLLYAFSENFVLPLSHDEVVHGKGSLLDKMPGDQWQKHANLRALYAWMFAHPGKQLLFMGSEVAHPMDWSSERSVDWHLLDHPEHRGTMELLVALNRLQKEHPALWQLDFDPAGFRWIDANDADQSVFSFLRWDANHGEPVACVANLTPVPRHGYRVGLPLPGEWLELLNSDWPEFGGSGVTNPPNLQTDDIAWHGMDQSVALTLPPLGVVWLARRR